MLSGYKKGEAGSGLRRPGWIVGVALLAGLIALWDAASQGAVPGIAPDVTAARAAHQDGDD